MGGRVSLTLVCVGRLRNRALGLVAEEYERRIGRYARLTILDVAHERVSRGRASAVAGLARAFGAPRERWALDEHGARYTSEGFSALLRAACEAGGGLSFVIGGPDGIPPRLSELATRRLSFSSLTLPHELFRVVFLEQLYRAFTIWRGEPYHRRT